MSDKKQVKEAGNGHCVAEGCKSSEKRFSFCEDHFDQFKFGIIKKDGHRVPDYDKKIEHYLAHKKRHGSQKVA